MFTNGCLFFFSLSLSFLLHTRLVVSILHPVVTDAALIVHSTVLGFFFFHLSLFCFFSLSCDDGSTLHGHKCTSNICLRICRGHCSHSSDVSVCRGPRAPSLSHQCGLSHTYLPVKSFIPLITGQ